LNGSLNVEVEQSTGEAQVRFIKDQLHQVLLNLILNAHQAAGEKSPITISVQHEAERIIIVMNDRGPGIREEALRTLFRPFQSQKETGLGIGLYQCKQMIEAQGGTIRIASRSGHGTTIRIELPRVTPALPAKQARS
jgi:signal transduction histidine kinase